MKRRSKSRPNRLPEPPRPPAPARPSRVARVVGSPEFLLAVLALAGVLRVVHVFALRETILFDHLQFDHLAYDQWAQEISHGNWLGTKVFFVDPLYAYFLGGLYLILGHDLMIVRLLQALIGVATCALTAILGRRVLGSAALGNLAALIMAMCIPGIFYEAAIEKTGLALFLFTLALAFFLDERPFAVLFSGLVFGLAVLARGNYLLLLPAGGLAMRPRSRRLDQVVETTGDEACGPVRRRSYRHHQHGSRS